MKSILMVCLGNICRSPLAEGLLQYKIDKHNLDIKVDSAGTSGHHNGEKPDSRMISTAKKRGLDISYIRSRKFKNSDFKEFDFIYVMDDSNYNNVISLTDNLEDQKKVQRILELVNSPITEVPDPYFGGESGFENVYNLLDEATNVIINKLKKGK